MNALDIVAFIVATVTALRTPPHIGSVELPFTPGQVGKKKFSVLAFPASDKDVPLAWLKVELKRRHWGDVLTCP